MCHGIWSAWDDWTSCSETCGAGLQTRRRAYDHDAKYMTSNGSELEVNSCIGSMCATEDLGKDLTILHMYMLKCHLLIGKYNWFTKL